MFNIFGIDTYLHKHYVEQKINRDAEKKSLLDFNEEIRSDQKSLFDFK